MHRLTTISALALTTAAGAQAPFTTGSTVTYTLSAAVIGGNSALPLEPGESLLVQINVSFTGQNTTAAYTPPSPPPGSGTIRGFGASFLDLTITASTGNGNGTWNTDFVNPGLGPALPGWDLLSPGSWGTPINGGSQLVNIQFGQFPVSAAAIITTNPINLIYQALWTPASYNPRDLTFALSAALPASGFPSYVLFKTGPSGVAAAYCNSTFWPLNLPVIPAPATIAPLALLLLAHRRR